MDALFYFCAINKLLYRAWARGSLTLTLAATLNAPQGSRIGRLKRQDQAPLGARKPSMALSHHLPPTQHQARFKAQGLIKLSDLIVIDSRYCLE
ncbi:hypothetical protein PIB30_046276 [Stylosanthes scabra]|uniref:Uncharacterized protein n=1 Tax=Stylosanthes scabra TaxID=79078 RepID=A0ABU6ZF72_9FABA|nr:hypothetical protein [Stylosanthes scabra]